jgi:hypothetical protein
VIEIVIVIVGRRHGGRPISARPTPRTRTRTSSRTQRRSHAPAVERRVVMRDAG